MREKTCCFTGHRQIPPGEEERIKNRLESIVTSLHHRGIYYYGAGGALGFDTLAAEAVLRLRERYPALRLILVLPCRDQTRGWRPEDVRRYERIRSRADKTVYTSQRYAPTSQTIPAFSSFLTAPSSRPPFLYLERMALSHFPSWKPSPVT